MGKREDTDASADNLRSWIAEGREKRSRAYPKGSSAVLIPIMIRDGAYHVLYEIRAARLRTQPGEICFPGGRIEQGETPIEAAVREAEEELCISKDQIEIVGELEKAEGPGGIPLFAFIGVLHDYQETWSKDEVDRVFTLPLDYILQHEPEIYKITLERTFPDDFPFEYVPGGKEYHWKNQKYNIPFYPGAAGQTDSDPVLWGATARVTFAFAQTLRAADSFLPA